MNTSLKQQVKVSDQTEALGLYLEALFREQPVVEEAQPEIAVEIIEQTEKTPKDVNDGRPIWAEQAFQTLFIDIDGMDIAIPMSAMSGIRKYPEHLGQIPDAPSWIDGTLESHGTNIQVVNARRLFLSSNNREIDTEEETNKPEFIVQIGDGRWGLACHSADRAVMLEPDQVRWSGSERRRLWLLGMIKEHLCALIDGEEFINYLDSGAKPL